MAVDVHGEFEVADVIENGLLNYGNVMKLQQEYGGGIVNYGTMGMYSGVEGMADAVRVANDGFHGEKDRPKGGSYKN